MEEIDTGMLEYAKNIVKKRIFHYNFFMNSIKWVKQLISEGVNFFILSKYPFNIDKVNIKKK